VRDWTEQEASGDADGDSHVATYAAAVRDVLGGLATNDGEPTGEVAVLRALWELMELFLSGSAQRVDGLVAEDLAAWLRRNAPLLCPHHRSAAALEAAVLASLVRGPPTLQQPPPTLHCMCFVRLRLREGWSWRVLRERACMGSRQTHTPLRLPLPSRGEVSIIPSRVPHPWAATCPAVRRLH
jgi:hypothetical protein